MNRALILHPESPNAAVDGITVEAERALGGKLVLRYVMRGRMGGVRWPSPETSRRGHELWRRTCFEAFLRTPGAPGYYEFNFSPSTQWAACHFSAYRDGMREVLDDEMGAPHIIARADEDSYELRAELSLELADGVDWELGISAVTEEVDGIRSFWSLAHPPGGPNFHHTDGFVLTLSALQAAPAS